MASKFDPQSFLNMEVKGSNSTSLPPMPEHEATLLVKDVALRTPKDSVILDVTFVVDSEEAREATGMEEPTVRHSIFLDVAPDGSLDMSEGKNVGLGRMREAVGQNDPNVPWSPLNLIGQVCRGKIGQQPDKNDPEVIYNRVKSLTSME